MRLTFWTAFWVFILDQFTKYVVVHALGLMTRLQIDVWPPFITFRMAWNRGVNFGLFSGLDMRWVLIGLAVVISGVVLYWVHRDGGNRWTFLSAGLLVGGAIGNVVDRLLYGAVADFLNMSCCGIDNPYAFNVADIAIFAGAIGLVIFTGSPGGGAAGGPGQGGGPSPRARRSRATPERSRATPAGGAPKATGAKGDDAGADDRAAQRAQSGDGKAAGRRAGGTTATAGATKGRAGKRGAAGAGGTAKVGDPAAAQGGTARARRTPPRGPAAPQGGDGAAPGGPSRAHRRGRPAVAAGPQAGGPDETP